MRDLEGAGFATFTGQATFTGPRTVRVGERVLESERILVATGSRTAVPPIEGIEEVDWIDHVSALDLTEVPRSLLVVGGGAVGLEFGQTFSRFGAQVRIVDAAERIAPLADAEASAMLAAALQDEGIELVTSVFVNRCGGTATRSSRRSRRATARRAVRAARRDGAARVGPRAERRGARPRGGRRRDDEGRDLGRRPAAHLGSRDLGRRRRERRRAVHAGRAVPGPRRGGRHVRRGGAAADYSVLPTAIFTDPELGSVGLTEEQAREQGHDVGVARNEHVKRFQFVGAEHGLFKVVFDRASRKVLGLHVVSRNAGDIVQGLSLGLRLGATVDDLAAMHHVFPTFGEGVKAAAERAVAVDGRPRRSAFMD